MTGIGELRLIGAGLGQLVSKSKVELLVIREDAPARRLADESADLGLVRQIEKWRLYEVISAKTR